MEEYQAKHVEAVTGVKRLRLNQWMEKGYFSPSIYKASQTGERNLYSLDDLYYITLFKKLVESGLSRSMTAVQITGFKQEINFKSVKEFLKNKDTVIYLLVARRFDDDDAIISLGGGDCAFLQDQTKKYFDDGYDQVCAINIGKIITEVDSKLKEI